MLTLKRVVFCAVVIAFAGGLSFYLLADVPANSAKVGDETFGLNDVPAVVIPDDSDTAKIEAAITNFGRFSREKDERRLDYVTATPGDFYGACEDEFASARTPGSGRDYRVPEPTSTQVDRQIESISRQIGEVGWEFVDVRQFSVNGDEARAVVDFKTVRGNDFLLTSTKLTASVKDVVFFLKKGSDGQWRIFTWRPQSLVKPGENLDQFGKVRRCPR